MTLALATVLGPFGAHRFYVSKTGTGALMAGTLGGLGLWWIYDLILVASGSFRDAQGRLVRTWEPEAASAADLVPADVLDELDALRHQVAELTERVEFAERMLAAPRPQRDPSLPGESL